MPDHLEDEMLLDVHQCRCLRCRSDGDHAERELHLQMNILFSRLDTQQRRLYAAIEANRIGNGGITAISRITGVSLAVIRRGRVELAS
jgi:hypothetical protein